VEAQATGQALLDYYSQRYPHSSPEEWLSRIEAGQILVNGQAQKPTYPLAQGQHLSYQRPPWQEPAVPLDFEVLYEDEDLWLIAKPSGLPVLPGGGFVEHTLLHQLQRRYPQEQPVPIHRLGRGTSGIMLIARSPLARQHLSQQLRERRLYKRYRALIGPGALPSRFDIDQPIGKIAYPRLGYLYSATPIGKAAQSQVMVLERRTMATLVAVRILTGRPHQIRIHLAAVGYPLWGDPLYQPGGMPRPVTTGPSAIPSDGGYWLHAQTLAFEHPRHGDWMTWTCPPPGPLADQ
jgi:23S rRNA pseudouridine1911/1915/1917 synthase